MLLQGTDVGAQDPPGRAGVQADIAADGCRWPASAMSRSCLRGLPFAAFGRGGGMACRGRGDRCWTGCGLGARGGGTLSDDPAAEPSPACCPRPGPGAAPTA